MTPRYVIRLSRDPETRPAYALSEIVGLTTSVEWHAKHYDSQDEAERVNQSMGGVVEACRCESVP